MIINIFLSNTFWISKQYSRIIENSDQEFSIVKLNRPPKPVKDV